MIDIDLIPPEYHKKRLVSSWLKRAVVICVLFSAMIIGGYFFLKMDATNLQAQLDRLQSQKEISAQQRQELEQLNERKGDLQQQMQLLTGLRSGLAVESMFIAVDRALPESQVWINQWSFRRAGTPVDEPVSAVNTGYFIVIPQGSETRNQQREETWEIITEMTIVGQSMDHAALSDFVIRLTRQPEIANARIVSTSSTEVRDIKLVNFTLDVIVATPGAPAA